MGARDNPANCSQPFMRRAEASQPPAFARVSVPELSVRMKTGIW